MGKKFLLKNYEIEFSDNMISYNKWNIYYRRLAYKAAAKYISDFYEKYDGLDDFSKYGLAGGKKIIQEAVGDTIQLCVDAKIYDIDEESFMKKYSRFCLSPWEDAFEEINDKYMEIVLKTEELDEYRSQRKASRARIIGGGFGFEGAMKGMVAAGAINLATGAVHGAFNLLGKGIDMIGNSMKKSSIFESHDTKALLDLGIWNSIYNIHYAVCDIFDISGIPNEARDKAAVLFRNIGRMPKEEVPKNIVEIISLNPYHSEVYAYWVENYGDSMGQLQEITDTFGIDLENIKNSLMEKEFSNIDLTTEESALEAKTKLQIAISKYGIQNSDLMKGIEEKLAAFDEKARTVEGKLFATREDAIEAAKELERIVVLMKQSDLNTVQGIERAISLINQENFTISTKNKYINELTESLSDKKNKEIKKIIKNGDSKSVIGIDILLETLKDGKYVGNYYQTEVTKLLEKRKELDGAKRTVNGIIYDTPNNAEQAKIENEKLKQILKHYDLSKTTDLKTVLQELKKSEFASKGALDKITAIENKYKYLEEKKRTIKGKVFESKEDFQKALNKARVIPIMVFIVIVGVFSVAIFQTNTSVLSSICIGICLASCPWLVFSVFKPEPATFYMISSRFKAAGLFVFIIILTMTIGVLTLDSKKMAEAKKKDVPIAVNNTNNKINSVQQNMENKQAKVNDDKEISFMGRIKGEEVRMRSEPSTASKIIGVFKNSEVINVIAITNSEERKWYKVKGNNGHDVWVAAEFCQLGE